MSETKDSKERTITFYKGELFFIQEALEQYREAIIEEAEIEAKVARGIFNKIGEAIKKQPE